MTHYKDLFADLIIHPDAEEAIACMRPLFTWKGPRWPKSLALYTYARNCKTGPIVELGTYYGMGAIALALGARDAGLGVDVFTIDSFTKRDGWVGGELYHEEDYDVFAENVSTVGLDDGIFLIRREATDALRFCEDYELFFWDIGGKNLVNDYMDWKEKCISGGTFIVKDTGNWHFGFKYVLEHAIESGEFAPGTRCPKGCLWSLDRIEDK